MNGLKVGSVSHIYFKNKIFHEIFHDFFMKFSQNTFLIESELDVEIGKGMVEGRAPWVERRFDIQRGEGLLRFEGSSGGEGCAAAEGLTRQPSFRCSSSSA